MKNCTDCKHAEWRRTEAGKLHPSGGGQCKYPYKLPPLPAAFWWTGTPNQSFGYINRREYLKDHCTYYARKDSNG